MLHPATLLLAWAVCALLLPLLPLLVLAALAVAVTLVAFRFAHLRTLTMLRRARWLFLSIAVMFAFATPGLSAPGIWGQLGVTLDGLGLAAEHVLRLLLLLNTLALLHEHLGTDGFVAGLYWLLGPVARWQSLRERILVRLILVLEFVEKGNLRWQDWLGAADEGPQSLALAIRQPRLIDWAVLTAIAGGIGVLAW
jgi:energy-coupling factor transporter transmembrane protein EcfT